MDKFTLIYHKKSLLYMIFFLDKVLAGLYIGVATDSQRKVRMIGGPNQNPAPDHRKTVLARIVSPGSFRLDLPRVAETRLALLCIKEDF